MQYLITIIIISILVIALIYCAFRTKISKNEDITPMNTIPNIIVNIKDLEKHAEEISNRYSDVINGRNNKKLLNGLDNNFKKILNSYDKVEEYENNYSDRLHAGEWLLDNMFLIKKEYKDLRNTIIEKYYKNLPILSKGIMKGYPRIYHIAVEMVSHNDGYIDENIIERFLSAYSKNTILTSSELWALPIMIRIAVIENIRNVAENLILAQDEKIKADYAAEKIITACSNNTVKQVIEQLSHENINFTYFFVERFFKLLKDNGIENRDVYHWIDEKLQMHELNYEHVVIEEHKKEAVMQLTIGNCINSIRRIEALNYRKYFEKISYVENLLKKDPAEIYEKMDFESRDYYRHNVEKLSKKFKLPESFIVKKALECANEAESSKDDYKKHIGYYLIDDGIKYLQNKLNIKPAFYSKQYNKISKNKTAVYIASIILGTILTTCLFINISLQNDTDIKIYKYIIAAIVLIIPCSEIVMSIINYTVNSLVSPRFIPKLDLKNSIDKENRTIVIIPTIISSIKNADKLLEKMEVYYLSNSQKNLYFTLLGDFKDSNRQYENDDNMISNYVLDKIKKLNNKYSNDRDNIFYYLSRYRIYNEKEHKYLAYERKRGKIMEFIKFLKGSNNTSYNIISSDISELKKAKYIITLDADTKLPRNTACRLIGAMAHVLNKPVIDSKKQKVIRGYGLLQPRISISVTSANKTIFSKIFSGETGIDVYTKAVSDVYQDLFGEGTFVGKGIFDIDVFYIMLNNKIPENSVLSHDLLEGCYVKAGLVTDIELIDDYPSYYNSNCKRLHRWVRGDWQLLPWIFKNKDLNALSKFKLIDNLRRSLLSVSVIALLILSFKVLPDGTDKWIMAAVIAFIFPILFNVSELFSFPKKGISLSGKITNVKTAFFQIFFIFCFLPYNAFLMIDAIVRTLYRLSISKEHLLEWQTAEEAEKTSGKNLNSYIKLMWPGSLIGVLVILLSFNKSINYGISMIPFCFVWIVSPIIAYVISSEKTSDKTQLSSDEKCKTRQISRRIFAYFEDFINEDTNYLAPDNYQEYPKGELAYRTSPTNLGMGLMSNIAAYDFGYIGMLKLIENLSKILMNMEKLDKFHGHYYNWYDIKSMMPLYPRYISTVDSGNLVGYMYVIGESLKEYINDKINLQNYLNGLKDTALIADDEINKQLGIKDYFCDNLKNIKDVEIFKFYKLMISIQKKADLILINDYNNYWTQKIKKQVTELIIELETLIPCIKNDEADEESYKEITQIFSSLSFSKIAEYDTDIINKEKIKDIITKVKQLICISNKIIYETDFTIVFDKERELFSIGYDVENDSLSKSYYDLLASEARQSSFIAIAKGDIQEDNWFKLGRSLTLIGNGKGLVSWSGTMFEYFMPLLIMKNYQDTLLYETYNFVLQGQKKYCNSRKVPWGISESAFYYFDTDLNYQYKAFGVPGIGVKRGLSDELVISPYSTFLAMMINHKTGYENIKNLIKEGSLGKYGFYEAIDYTKSRLKGKSKELVKCFMVHHEGMSIMALDNIINDNILQKRFHNIPEIKAAELLLQEKPSKNIVYTSDKEYSYDNDKNTQNQVIIVRKYNTAKTIIPKVNLLSNGEFSLMISNSGSGYSKKGDMFLYRYKNDVTLDNSGMFFYIKDISCNKYFSAAYQPCKVEADNYEVEFSLDKAVFKRKDNDLFTKTEVIVSSEDSAEIRKINITNDGKEEKIIEVTSYCEITLSKYFEDLAHPSFQDLFIQTEFIDSCNCIIAKRRSRKQNEKEKWIMQTVIVKGESIGTVQYETSKINFVGRGNDLTNPICIVNDSPLKNNTGIVLCPIISLRKRVKIPSSKKCELIYITAAAFSKEEIINLAKKYNEYSSIERCFKLAYTQCQLDIKYLGIKSAQANLYQIAASKILFLDTCNKNKNIKEIKGNQQTLWKYGISGDLPIMLVMCKDNSQIDIVRQTIKAYEYYETKGLETDLIILNMEENSYERPLDNYIKDLILSSSSRDKVNQKGGIYLFGCSSITENDLELLKTVAKIVVDSDKGPFACQIKDKLIETNNIQELKTQNIVYDNEDIKYSSDDLIYFNGYGGFSKDYEKYVIILDNNKNTPLPWINVISNKKFGFIVSERGSSYTWNQNSRENKLSTWSNDWVSDWSDENLYVRDEINGEVWSLTCSPIRTTGQYVIEHGFGYSNFKHNYNGINGEISMFVPQNDNVKICILNLKNNTNKIRRLSIIYFTRLVLGTIPEQTSQHITTYIDNDNKYIYGFNNYNKYFEKMKAYLKIVGGSEESFTGDREEFVGRCNEYKGSAALKMEHLSNIAGVKMDPCLAENSKISIEPSGSKTVVILFGEEDDINKINMIINKYSEIESVKNELENTKLYWQQLLHKVTVDTPDTSMNIMMNGWLMYQTICCRLWARTAFYQCGGAYGFRDQLQDSMNVLYLNSEISRKQIIYSASKQYLEGDVQHWWHPVIESGIRTRYSDDLLWLPYAVIEYIKSCGDYEILDTVVPYIEDSPLNDDEDERYNIVSASSKNGTLYEHCIKAIEMALKFGEHNIPLMGCGDWNDGMNKIGSKGKGESVWLGFFLYKILDDFVNICSIKGDKEKVTRYTETKEFIIQNIEKYAWDGSWYKRAFFDDGTPLGSIENDECQIDSISQSWSVLSNGADKNRAKIAMEGLENNLVKEDKGMVLLLNPPFDKSKLQPGYIKGYVPGVRENGGQYTHAAAWVILAFSEIKMHNKAWKIFNSINPINHTLSYFECQTYKCEPYVMAADVYAKEPHIGRGGWTWYTGSSGWMYRSGIKGILGLNLKGNKGFTVEPCIPDNWSGYKMTYIKNKCVYDIQVKKGVNKAVKLDGKLLKDDVIPYLENGTHLVEVQI